MHRRIVIERGTFFPDVLNITLEVFSYTNWTPILTSSCHESRLMENIRSFLPTIDKAENV